MRDPSHAKACWYLTSPKSGHHRQGTVGQDLQEGSPSDLTRLHVYRYQQIAIVQPIQVLQDLYIELSNILAETKSNKIFHMLEWDAMNRVTCSTNVITQHIPNLTVQMIIDNTATVLQHVQPSGPIMAEVILCTILNDMVFMTYEVLNSIEDPRLCAQVEADLSGHPQNERSGPLALFYLIKNICNV
jgi:hypothetical protein